jgi:hypothetical protein
VVVIECIVPRVPFLAFLITDPWPGSKRRLKEQNIGRPNLAASS